MDYVISGTGLFEPASHLLGCDLETMSEINMRKGILEFIDVNTRWKLAKLFMDKDP